MSTLSGNTKTPTDLFEMSDADFINMGAPPRPAEESPAPPETPAPAPEPTPAHDDGDPPVGDEVEETSPTEPAKNPLGRPDSELGEAPAKPGAPTETPAEPAPAGHAEGDKPVPVPAGSEAGEAPDYQKLYEEQKAINDRLLAPLKANGKTIELRSPDELLSLAQMGANYTKKLQELTPYRKMQTMLEKHGITEDRLSFLLDVGNKNPAAIQKLLKDSGIDPMDIDTSAPTAYVEGSHQVTDEEVAFRSVLGELNSNPAGQETIQHINTHWDQASKQALWGQPDLMSAIHEQRANGVYARIVEEVDRQKTLGQLPPTTSFIQAYAAVGKQLQDAGGFGTPQNEGDPAPAPVVQPAATPQVVATRAAAPKSTLANNDKASAAAPSRSTSRKPASEFTNPLGMSDGDFMKNFEALRNRL